MLSARLFKDGKGKNELVTIIIFNCLTAVVLTM